LIYIDISQLNIPEKWAEEARQLTEQLRSIPEDQRSAFINQNSRIWQRLKPELERLSHDKCWYCETKNIRADFHVDHHRPKNKVTNENNVDESEGYWWLAFDYTNFRLACSYCNCLHTGTDGVTRGKSDRFPLLSSSCRVSSPDSNIDDEMPLLLDPTNPADPSMLWFIDDGRAFPKFSEDDGVLYRRAVITIDVLNLNDVKIIEERKKLWNHCMRLIERGNKAFEQYKNGSPTGKKEFEMIIQEMNELTQPPSEFSATALACFRGSSSKWVREIAQ
jgi:uncharacterized protein (TIGR02646 family)